MTDHVWVTYGTTQACLMCRMTKAEIDRADERTPCRMFAKGDNPRWPSRLDYLEGKVAHYAYYSAINETAGFVVDHTSALVTRAMGCVASGDGALNTIPLIEFEQRAFSDQIRHLIGKAMELHGDHWSMVGAICAYKQAVLSAINRRIHINKPSFERDL